jgi:hypothetical protein
MSESGQSLPKRAVRAMSGLPPIATKLRTSLEVRFVPEPDFADMFNLGQRADVCWLACLVQACHLQSANSVTSLNFR